MKEINKSAFVGYFGILGLVTAGLVSMGCSSSSNSTGTGGTTGGGGKGGSSATGNGGSSATGNGGSAATGTGGGGGAALGCAMSDPPASATIADFASADGGVEIMGGITTYGGVAAPMYTVTGGVLNITDMATVGTAAQYVGLVIYFNGNAAGTDCINASTYTGVQFDISGTLTGPGCSIQYSTNDSEHEVYAADDIKGACASGCYAPQLSIPSLMSAPQTMKVAFAGGAPNPGNPATDVDPTKITGVQWQLTVPATSDGGPTECDLNLNIDNVMFYN